MLDSLFSYDFWGQSVQLAVGLGISLFLLRLGLALGAVVFFFVMIVLWLTRRKKAALTTTIVFVVLAMGYTTLSLVVFGSNSLFRLL